MCPSWFVLLWEQGIKKDMHFSMSAALKRLFILHDFFHHQHKHTHT